jgi:O-methyltransferase involved in polyketide biosynthesis
MINKIKVNLGIFQETFLITLWARSVEASHHNPILKDPKTVEIIEQIDYDLII